jgi:hypothetical protein
MKHRCQEKNDVRVKKDQHRFNGGTRPEAIFETKREAEIEFCGRWIAFDERASL